MADEQEQAAGIAAIRHMAQTGIDDMRDAVRYLRTIDNPEARRLALGLIVARVLLAKLNGIDVDIPT